MGKEEQPYWLFRVHKGVAILAIWSYSLYCTYRIRNYVKSEEFSLAEKKAAMNYTGLTVNSDIRTVMILTQHSRLARCNYLMFVQIMELEKEEETLASKRDELIAECKKLNSVAS